MRHRRLNISFPPNWEPIPGENRAFRKKELGSGTLRISLNPPLDNTIEDGKALLTHLRAILGKLNLDHGSEIRGFSGNCSLGPIATTLWQSPNQGLLQFWLIKSEATIFATYTMGTPETAEKELAESQHVINNLYFEDVK